MPSQDSNVGSTSAWQVVVVGPRQMTPSLMRDCACSDPLFVAFVEDQIVEPCEHLKPKQEKVDA